MLIEFKIQLDGSGAATVTQAQAAPNPSLPKQHELPVSFVATGAGGTKGGDAPVDGPGAGTPSGTSSGPGMVFVIGPIVICGSGPGNTGPGGDAPVDGPGAGGPKGRTQTGV